MEQTRIEEVLIVTDMVKGFHNRGNLANPRVAGIIPNIVQLIKKKRAAGCKIIFLNDCHKPDDEEFRIFPEHCVKGTPEAELINEVERERLPNDPVVHKTKYSGFYGTCLDYLLSQIGAKRATLTGVCTDICVLHTAAELKNRGYEVIVPLNCVETYDAPNHPAEETAQWAIEHMTGILGVKII